MSPIRARKITTHSMSIDGTVDYMTSAPSVVGKSSLAILPRGVEDASSTGARQTSTERSSKQLEESRRQARMQRLLVRGSIPLSIGLVFLLICLPMVIVFNGIVGLPIATIGCGFGCIIMQFAVLPSDKRLLNELIFPIAQ